MPFWRTGDPMTLTTLERVALAIHISDIGGNKWHVAPRLRTLWFKRAGAALKSLREPSPRAVARTADAMQMDATKVAGVWMTMVDAMLKEE